jgi:hypothetical protein
MNPKDFRSFKLAILADCFVNPVRYPAFPRNSVVYEVLRDLGYGILKMPELNAFPEETVSGWVELVADQAEEYVKRGYLVVAVGYADLPDYGVYYSLVEKEMASRGLEPPRLVIYRREEVGNRDLIVQRLSIPL